MSLLNKLFKRKVKEETKMTNQTLKIGIVQGSVREGRNGDSVAK